LAAGSWSSSERGNCSPSQPSSACSMAWLCRQPCSGQNHSRPANSISSEQSSETSSRPSRAPGRLSSLPSRVSRWGGCAVLAGLAISVSRLSGGRRLRRAAAGAPPLAGVVVVAGAHQPGEFLQILGYGIVGGRLGQWHAHLPRLAAFLTGDRKSVV